MKAYEKLKVVELWLAVPNNDFSKGKSSKNIALRNLLSEVLDYTNTFPQNIVFANRVATILKQMNHEAGEGLLL